MTNSQDQCVKSVHDWNRADKALGCSKLNQAETAMHEAKRDGVEALLALARPESLRGAGCLIQHAARGLAGAIPDELQRSLFGVGARLRQNRATIADLVALREAIALIKFLPAVGEEFLPVAVSALTINGCDVLCPEHKDNILSMFGRALDFVARPRSVCE